MKDNSVSYPLSSIQRGMLYENISTRKAGLNVGQAVIQIQEAVEFETISRAWKRVVHNYPIFRCRFRWEGLPAPIQEILEDVPVFIHPIDWSRKTQEERNELFQKFILTDRNRGFLLNQVPLFRITLIRCSETECKIILTFSSLLLDEYSISIILKQLFQCYESLQRGIEYVFPNSPSFQDYIERLEQKDFSVSQPLWKDTLKGISAATSIGIDPSIEKIQINTWHLEERRQLKKSLTSALKSFAQEKNVTAGAIVYGAWAYLLHRYSGEQDVIYGIIRSCRDSQLEVSDGIVGILINPLPMRIKIDPSETVTSYLMYVQKLWDEMQPHIHTPLPMIHDWSEIPYNIPLFESLVVFEENSINAILRKQDESWKKRHVTLHEQTSFPLNLSGYLDDEMQFILEYDPQLFNASKIVQLLDHMEIILSGIAAYPEQKLRNLPLLTSDEEKRILFEWNQTSAVYPKEKCIHQLIEEMVETFPNIIAVVHGEQDLTYQEFNRKANQLANYLIRLGVTPGTYVGLYTKRSINMAIGILGILKAGGVYVPLDPEYPEDFLTTIIEDCRFQYLVSQSDLSRSLPYRQCRVVLVDEEWSQINQENGENPTVSLNSEQPAIIIYTSGSTGEPKGIVVSHRSFVNYHVAAARLFQLHPQDRVLQYSKINFDMASHEIFPTWVSGAALVIYSEGMLTSHSDFMRSLIQDQITVLHLITNLWHQWVHNLVEQKESLPPTLRLVTVGGENASLSVYKLWRELSQNRVRWINVYGPAETTVGSTMYDPWIHGEPVSRMLIGKPIANTQVYVVDDLLRPVPVGIPGELLIGGDGVALGYLNDPELTTQKFIENPFSNKSASRLFKTGDRVRYLSNGNLEYLGRTDRYVKIRGFRIDLGEIEAVLLRHPNILDAVVIDQTDEREEKHLSAFVIPRNPDRFTVPQLREDLKNRLPHYVIPADIFFLPEFPKTAGGKVDRKALLDWQIAASAPDDQYAPPRLPIEMTLADIWQEVLGIERIGIHDDFFDVGGDSLYIIQIIDRALMFGLRINPEKIFQLRTIAKLAEAVEISRSETKQDRSWGSLVALRPSGTNPPIYFIHDTGGHILSYGSLVNRLGPDQPCYGFQSLGLSFKEKSHSRIEDMAAYYVHEMLEFDPEGPYIIGGFCHGGVVAYEMAQLLHAQGKKILVLALLETPALPPRGFPIRFYGDHLKNILRIGPKKWRFWVIQLWNHYYKRILNEQPDFDFNKIAKTDLSRGPFANLSYVHRMNREAEKQYYPTRYPGKVTLFCSMDMGNRTLHHSVGWRSLAKEVELHETPGQYNTMMKEPNAEYLAQEILKCIHSALNES